MICLRRCSLILCASSLIVVSINVITYSRRYKAMFLVFPFGLSKRTYPMREGKEGKGRESLVRHNVTHREPPFPFCRAAKRTRITFIVSILTIVRHRAAFFRRVVDEMRAKKLRARDEKSRNSATRTLPAFLSSSPPANRRRKSAIR